MGSLLERNPSLWVATSDRKKFVSVPTGSRFDVVVVGAGIAGLTTARLLSADGASVAVLEAGEVATGATGYTSAKVSALQRTTLGDLRGQHGQERVAAYAAANAATVETVAGLVEDDGIDCDFERAAACTYATDRDAVADIEKEHETATAAGLNTRLDASTELPFDVAAAVWLDNQAQFHPRRYCLGVADAVVAAGSVVAERARVLEVGKEPDGCKVITDEGTVHADQVVVASHLPFMHAGGFFARAHAYRSYALAARVRGERLRGMYISSKAPTRSARSTADGWTVLGGEGHKVGHDDDTRQRYEALENWARASFDIEQIDYRWSAQDYETVDGMPYVGHLTSGGSRVWVATGFRKWGMTNGTAAAMILADLISGRPNPWAEAFDSTRLAPRASLKSLVTENVEVGKRLVGDRLRTWRPSPAKGLEPGEGGVVELNGETVAAFRDDAGALHAVSADCTHLGCRLAFNTAERSWDCPCHGSRFGLDGRVLQGPAVKDLSVKGT